MSVERTNLLHQLFVSSLSTRPRGALSAKHTAQGALRDPFAEGFASVNAMAGRSMVDATCCIRGCLKAMAQHSPVVTVEGGLMVADAELSSAAESAKAFAVLMERARSEVARRGGPDAAAADEDLELVAHYATAANTLVGLVAQRRLDLTICREALEGYKRELSAPVSMWLCIDGSEGRSPQRARGGAAGATSHLPRSHLLDGVAEDLQLHAHLRTAADKAAQTAAVGRKVLEGATDMVASSVANTMLNLARKTTAVTRKVAAGGTVDEVLSAVSGSPVPNSSPAGALSSPAYVYTEDERRALERQREMMQLEERVGSAASAKDIEATINELSQLTSLMQTRVLEQDEQLVGLEKNAVEATATIQKASEELRQPLKSRWSATMQMTALLWLSSIVILGAHVVVG